MIKRELALSTHEIAIILRILIVLIASNLLLCLYIHRNPSLRNDHKHCSSCGPDSRPTEVIYLVTLMTLVILDH